MRKLFSDWNTLKEPDIISLNGIWTEYEAYMTEKFKERFPELNERQLEKYSRAGELWINYPEAHRKLHNELYEHHCRCCKQSLPEKYYICEWFYGQAIHLCEHCHGLILTRERIEELYESISKELKWASNTQEKQDDILSK